MEIAQQILRSPDHLFFPEIEEVGSSLHMYRSLGSLLCRLGRSRTSIKLPVADEVVEQAGARPHLVLLVLEDLQGLLALLVLLTEHY